MTRKGLRYFLILLLVLGLNIAALCADKTPTKSPAATAAQKSQQPSSKKAKEPKALKYRGEISAVDAAKGMVAVKGEAGEKRFVTQDAAKDALERLDVGDTVRVLYTEKDKKLVASSVRRLKVKSTKPAASETPASKSKPPAKNSKPQAR